MSDMHPPFKFEVNDLISKVGGDYSFDGTVVARFRKVSGKDRYVCEDDRGVLHVFGPANLKLQYDEDENEDFPPDLEAETFPHFQSSRLPFRKPLETSKEARFPLLGLPDGGGEVTPKDMKPVGSEGPEAVAPKRVVLNSAAAATLASLGNIQDKSEEWVPGQMGTPVDPNEIEEFPEGEWVEYGTEAGPDEPIDLGLYTSETDLLCKIMGIIDAVTYLDTVDDHVYLRFLNSSADEHLDTIENIFAEAREEKKDPIGTLLTRLGIDPSNAIVRVIKG